MARGKMFQVRLSDEELAQAEAGAAAGGYENVSQFIRACIRRGAHAVGGRVDGISVSSPAGEVHLNAEQQAFAVKDGVVCVAAVRHRKGVYCKHCGVTP